jgi:hypothetical protein
MSSGCSIAEVADQVGETTGWVTRRLSRLRVEIERMESDLDSS